MVGEFIYQNQFSKTKANEAITNLKTVQRKLLDRLKEYNNTSVKTLQDALNNMFSDNQYISELSEKLFNNLVLSGDKALDEMTPSSRHMGVQYKNDSLSGSKINSLRQEYFQLKAEADQGHQAAIAALSGKRGEEIWRAIQKLQVSLNRVNGKLFENLLQISEDFVQSVASKKSGEKIDAEVEALLKVFDNQYKTKTIKTAGSDKVQLTYLIDGKEIKYSATGKVDIKDFKVPNLKSNYETQLMQISAKSYASLSNINLLTGRVWPLIADWPGAKNETKNYFYNALHFSTEEEYLNHTRLIFGIQSLIGLEGDSSALAADVLITYIRNRKQPIVVHSIKKLLKDIIKSDDSKDAFLIKFSKPLPLSSNKETFTKEIKNLDINTHLNKKYLKVEYIRKLYEK